MSKDMCIKREHIKIKNKMNLDGDLMRCIFFFIQEHYRKNLCFYLLVCFPNGDEGLTIEDTCTRVGRWQDYKGRTGERVESSRFASLLLDIGIGSRVLESSQASGMLRARTTKEVDLGRHCGIGEGDSAADGQIGDKNHLEGVFAENKEGIRRNNGKKS